ncbi:hypothetical protein VB780_03445 [Leptolyngbya sp. CCNP1308]|uniref:hypothetical protein n=1 Tax=Leptolyngbya sp. CCNP1308 TaxID=3110255 RepID=UPI002B220B1A|nr:hypothetical protein [Leptolyngbya sp. CCNP1308]MEA5447609.1 hypothetical protein [Leptolyngbya sp. CCNP1308]
MENNPTQIVVHEGQEISVSAEVAALIQQAAALAAQEALRNAGLAANGASRGLGSVAKGATVGVGKIISDTVAEVKTDLKNDPKRFRIGVQRMVFACGLTGFLCLFTGVAIGLGDPAHQVQISPAEHATQTVEEAAK